MRRSRDAPVRLRRSGLRKGTSGSEDLAGLGGVRGDLGRQLLETSEFLLRSDEIDERDAQMTRVEIYVDVKEMDVDLREVDLEPGHEAADRRAQTGIGAPLRPKTFEKARRAFQIN